MLKSIVLLFVGALFAFGQGTYDLTGASSTSVFAVHSGEPGRCTVPEVYFNDVTGKFRYCSSKNVWSDLTSATGSTTPGAGLIPKGLPGGTLDPNWLVVAAATATGQSASISTTPLLVGGVQAPAGFYRLNVWAEPTSGHTGSGTVAVVTSWKSEGSTYAVTGNAVSLASTSTTSFALPITFHHDGTANISYSSTYASTGQYSLYVILERLSNQ